jgi:hypothetical protein
MIPHRRLIPAKMPVTIQPADVQMCARWCELYADDKPRCIERCYLRYLQSVLDTLKPLPPIKDS